MLRKLTVVLGMVALMLFSGCSSKPTDPEGLVKHYIENVIKKRDLSGAKEYFVDEWHADKHLGGMQRNIEENFYGEDIDNLEYKIKLKNKSKNEVIYNVVMRNTTHKKAYYRDWKMRYEVTLKNMNGGWKITYFLGY